MHLIFSAHARTMWNAIKMKLRTLNVFESELAWFDQERRQREVIATRIYIVLLVIFAVILVNYSLLEIQTQSDTIIKPSQSDFEQLETNEIYASTLDCACENINVPYRAFISLVPHYHQVCQSEFITIDFQHRLFNPNASLHYLYSDYRLFAVPQFQLLSSLCSLAKETVSTEIDLFASKAQVTGRAQSRTTVEAQARSVISQFQLSITNTFNRSFDLILNTIEDNG
jgi:hypothetical protein